MSRNTVTVVVPTYNRAAYLGECLNSLLGQSVPPHEVIVVDDGSTDDTRDVVQSFMPRILYYRKPNGGKSAALNLGLMRATGDFVWVFDDDDVALPDAIERHLACFEMNPGIGFTYSTYYAADTAADGRAVAVRDVKVPRIEESVFLIRLLETGFIPHPSSLVRHDLYRQVGLFNERLVRAQDHEMFIRLARVARCAMVVGPTYLRRYHQGVRGSRADSFAVEDYTAAAYRYEKEFYADIWRSLSLDEYLPRRRGTLHAMQPGNLGEAQLQRMAIMAAKGLWSEALCDLGDVLEQYADRHVATLGAEFGKTCYGAMLCDRATCELARDRSKRQELMRVAQGSEMGRAILWHLAKGALRCAREMGGIEGSACRLAVWRLAGELLLASRRPASGRLWREWLRRW